MLTAESVLLGTGSAHDDWVDSLKMGWVSQQSDGNLSSRSVLLGLSTSERGTQVVFDITSIFELVCGFGGWHTTLEFSHNNFHGLTYDIGQHVESASVWHTNNEISGTIVNGGVDSTLEAWGEGLATFETESLHSVELLSEEGAEVMSPIQSVVKVELLLVIHAVVLDTLKVNSNPIANIALRDVGEFNANLTAVGILVGLDDVSKLPDALLLQNSGGMWQFNRELTVQISLSKSVVFVVEAVSERLVHNKELAHQVLVIFVNFLNLQWIQVGDQMTNCFESVEKCGNLDRLLSSALGSHTGDTTRTTARLEDGKNFVELTLAWGLAESRGRLKGGSTKVGMPGSVHAGWVLLPLLVHVVNVVGATSGKEAVV